jgi:LacI family repressor for deo operon, udp, cdd, tsx, nupC, and nupG
MADVDPSRKSYRITLADVARKAGVSSATASQVLNNRPNCWASLNTRSRILTAARELGYRPNLTARSLREGRTQSIGAISPMFYVGTHHNRATGIFAAARHRLYAVVYSAHGNQPEQEESLIQLLLDKGVDGLIVQPTDAGPHEELRRLASTGFPVVTLDGSCSIPFDCDDVSADYTEVGRLQIAHLLALGRKRVALVNHVPALYMDAVREDAIRQELEKENLPPPLLMDLPFAPGDSELPPLAPLEASLRAFFAENKGQFDCLVGSDYAMSLSMRLLAELKIRVPEDVALVGTGDTPLAAFGITPLSSVSVNDMWIGEQAFKTLMTRLENPTRQTFRHLFSTPSLAIRASSYKI